MKSLLIWAALLGLPFVVLATQLHWGEAVSAAAYAYPQDLPRECPFPMKAAAPADARPRFQVRAPSNYEAAYPHPLLVVFSPAGASGGLTERWIGVTHEATARGVVVAYVDSMRLRPEVIPRFADAVSRIRAGWCIDPDRITYTGHSDGGTVAQVLTLMSGDGEPRPTAVIASGAGLQAEDFREFTCRGGLDVLLYHGSRDKLFPGFGESAAQAWAGCLQCGPSIVASDNCRTFTECDGSLQYCERDAGHMSWLPATEKLLDHALRPRAG